MARVGCRLFFTVKVCAFVASTSWSQTPAVDAPDPSGDSVESAERERAEKLFRRFSKSAASIDLVTATTDEKLSLVDKPLFRFTSEGSVFGSVHIWKDPASRLAVVGTIGSLPINNIDFEFIELHLLKPEAIVPVTIPGRPTKRWNPVVEPLALKPVAGAPAVAESDRMRLTQMRAMARQFSAEMQQDQQTHQLRLLPSPLYRYAASTPDRDGALFAFVWDTGTDPELLLRVETIAHEGQATWHYQPIRFTWRELTLTHRSAQVWQVEEFVGRDLPDQNSPYLTGLTQPIP